MFRIICDPSSGSIQLYLTEIHSGSLMFVMCLVGVWQRNFEPVVCAYGTTGWKLSPSLWWLRDELDTTWICVYINLVGCMKFYFISIHPFPPPESILVFQLTCLHTYINHSSSMSVKSWNDICCIMSIPQGWWLRNQGVILKEGTYLCLLKYPAHPASQHMDNGLWMQATRCELGHSPSLYVNFCCPGLFSNAVSIQVTALVTDKWNGVQSRSIGLGKLRQCFSTAGLRPGTGPWHQLYRAARGSPGICHFSFLCIFHE